MGRMFLGTALATTLGRALHQEDLRPDLYAVARC